jgi:hypothetical protein
LTSQGVELLDFGVRFDASIAAKVTPSVPGTPALPARFLITDTEPPDRPISITHRMRRLRVPKLVPSGDRAFFHGHFHSLRNGHFTHCCAGDIGRFALACSVAQAPVSFHMVVVR